MTTEKELTQLMTDYGYTKKEQENFREFATIWLTRKRQQIDQRPPENNTCDLFAQRRILNELLGDVESEKVKEKQT
jgi:hypothetical protein